MRKDSSSNSACSARPLSASGGLAFLAAALIGFVGCEENGADEGNAFTSPPAVAPPTTMSGGATGFSPVLPGPSLTGSPGGNGPSAGPVSSNDAGPPISQPSPPTTASLDTLWCKAKAVLDKNCTACHQTPAAGGAPFALTAYNDLLAAAPGKPGSTIFERVAVRVSADKSQSENLGVMPPGRQLDVADRATIEAWITAGTPAGDNPLCTPPNGSTGTGGSPVPAVEWPPKECDGVYSIVSHGPGGPEDPYMVPVGRETQGNVPWDPPWGNDEVQAIAFKTITDNSKVLHHWILYAQGAFITGWAPGEDGVRLMKPDVGMLLPGAAGSLTMNVHYYNTAGTQVERDNSGVEVCVVKRNKFRKNSAAVTMGLSNIFNLSIPANVQNHEISGSCTVSGSQPITLLSASPHAHTLARRMQFTVTKKSGETIVMHDQPFMFGDQKSFALDPPVVVEAGDVINTSCFYTNDTGRTVTFGENTGNEMCFNFAVYYPAGALNCGLGGLFGGLGGIFDL